MNFVYVTNGEIVEKIYKREDYKSLCKSLARKPHLAEELHSTFILELLEIKDDRLIKAEQEGYLDTYCVGIIHHVWNKRNRVKTYIVGHTSPLFEYSSTLETTKDYFHQPDEPYEFEYDYVKKEVEEIIQKDWDNPNKSKMYSARVFYYSHLKYNGPGEFSEKSGIPYMAVWQTCRRYKKVLRKFLRL